MSLQGSLETIALPDVMALLASSNKSGELRVVGGQLEGRLWLDDGRLVVSQVGKAHDHVEAMFELLCLTEGSFVFKEGVQATDPGEAMPVAPVVRQAEERLLEWREIERTVPSLEHRVRLIADLPTPEVTLTADDWRLVMAVALAGTVRGALEELSLSHFDCCRGIRRLVDAGLVIVEPPRVRPPSSDPARAARRSAAAHGSAPINGSIRSPRLPRRPAVGSEGQAGVAAHLSQAAPVDDGFPAGDGFRVEEEPGDPDVVYFPLRDDGYDMSQFAMGDEAPAAPPPFAVAPHNDRLAVPWDEPESEPPMPDTEMGAAVAAAAAAVSARAGGRAATATVRPAVPAATAPATTPRAPAAPAPGGRKEQDPEGDPINRGLLLKFLSSVRS